jgi:membrane-associated protease RseP (regulator of RpoE activity)
VPAWLLYALGVFVFAFGLLASIALHEIGHMLPAKKFGVKVTQYMVGFGPTLWSRTKGDTEYGIKAIPAGGYIRMIGMVPPRADGKVSRWPRRFATAIEDFRQMSRAEVEPGDEARQFYRLTPGKKMIVMLGGPCMNLLIFLVLFVALITTLGLPNTDPNTTVNAVEQCVVPANSKQATAAKCPATAPRAPAQGKLQPGDRFESVNGTAITSWNQLVTIIQASPGKPLSVVVRRDGHDVPVTITPVRNRNYVGDSDKKLATVGYLGVEPQQPLRFETVGVSGVPGQIGHEINLGVSALGRYPEKIKSLWDTVFEGKKRDPNGAVGVVGIGRISGDYARSDLLNAKDKVFVLINLLAGVNLLLFFFNLLPLLPLDGGHVARRRGARDAHSQIFVDTAQMLPVMYAVASVLVVLTLLTLYADIVKPINPTGG